jgi:hypothetical protein
VEVPLNIEDSDTIEPVESLRVLALAAAVGLAGALADGIPDRPAPAGGDTPRSESDARSRLFRGSITKLDLDARTLVMKDERGRATAIQWTEATHIAGELQEGVQVEVEAVEKDGRNVATEIRARAGKSY